MRSVSLINFTELNESQTLMVLAWRNDERVTKFMKNKSVSLEEHLKFIASLKGREDKRYFLVAQAEQNGKNEGEAAEYIGVIDFVDITRDSCEFGLYANPELKGQGKTLMQIIVDYAFNELKVKRINSCAYNQNEKAIALYRKFGFEIYDKDEEMSYLSLSLNANLL